VRQLQSLLDRSRSQHDSLQRQVTDQSNELDSIRSNLTSSRHQLAASEQELDRVKAEQRIQSAGFQDMQAERELAQIEARQEHAHDLMLLCSCCQTHTTKHGILDASLPCSLCRQLPRPPVLMQL